MCVNCQQYNYICPDCGEVLDSDYIHLKAYYCLRRNIKNLLWSSQSDNFVWLLRFEGKIVKVGFGNLIKLLNETRPNANYTRFDSVFLYYCNNEEERNEFACRCMGEIDGVINRRGVHNNRYKTKKELRWSNPVNPETRDIILGDPDFAVGDSQYYDIDRLQEYGVR